MNKIVMRSWTYDCGEPGCCFEYGTELIVNDTEVTRHLDMYDWELVEGVLKALVIEYEVVEEGE